MAGQTEIVLANSSRKTLPAKVGKSRTRRKGSLKPAKKTVSHNASKPANENKTAGRKVVPRMKLRAINIADEAKPESSETSQNGKVLKDGLQKDGSQIILMPEPALLPNIAGNETANTYNARINVTGSEHAEGANGTDAVSDPELLELLEQLSVTIDTANSVLGAAVMTPAEEIISSKPEPEPEPKPDSESDDPPPLAAQFASSSPLPPPPTHHTQKQGISRFTTAIIASLSLAAGIGWLLYTNPWLLEGKTKVTAQPDFSTTASLKESTTPTLANIAPAATPAAVPASPQLQTQRVTASSVTTGQPVAGKIGQPIALAINLPEGAADTAQSEISVMIQGVPEKAQLSAGKSLGSGNWLLSEAELQNLTLNTEAMFTPASFELDVILVTSDGKIPDVHKLPVTIEAAGTVTAATDGAGPPSSATTYVHSGVSLTLPATPSRAEIVTAPTPATPAQEPSVAKSPSLPALTSQEVRTLLARANSILKHGDIASARLLLEYAALRGSKQAMLKMGETYDPDHLSRLGVRGVQPDQEQAALWYDRAAITNTAR